MNLYFFERDLEFRSADIERAVLARQRLADARSGSLDTDRPAAARPVIRRSAPFGLRFLRREG